MTSERSAIARARAVGADPGTAEATRTAMVDGLSVALAGAVHPVVTALAGGLGLSENTTPLPGHASVWFTGRTAVAAQAALLNGTAIHVNEFDDTHDAAIVHCMSAVLPAAVAGAELATGRPDIAGAVAAGTELACNLALSRERYAGWHYTTLCGTLGAALACAVAAGANSDVVASAVGNGYVFAAGNKQAVLDSSLMKRVMPGFAAQNGVLAYQAASSGLAGVDNWLTGPYGLWELFYGGSAEPAAIAGGERARVAELSYKPYPACRFTHGAIEAAARLRHDLDARGTAALGEVDVRYPALDRFGIVCRPYARRGADVMDAQFSTAYLVAATLVHGRIDFGSYTAECLAEERVADLATRVRVTCDLPPGKESDLGPIEVRAGGRAQRIDTALGSPERPLSEEARLEKLRTCVQELRRRDGTADADADALWHELVEYVASAGEQGADAEPLLDRIRVPLSTRSAASHG